MAEIDDSVMNKFCSFLSPSFSSSLPEMRAISQLLVFYFLIAIATAWRPCNELSPALRLPCRCKLQQVTTNSGAGLGAVLMDCDNVVFANDAPTFPNGAPIISYTQRNSGQQAIPTQVSNRRTIVEALEVAEE